MVVPKDVQSAMHHQSQHLFPNGNTLPLRVVAGDLRTNVDVSNYSTTFPGSPESKRDHVRSTVMLKVAAIQSRHRGSPDERDR